jgi:MSHA pilin protein MshC
MNKVNTKPAGANIIVRGFSLLELIIMLIIIGVLSVTVVPKFLTTKGFAEYAYQDDIIAKLRLVQTKAMQQTDANTSDCHTVLITTKQLGVPDINCQSFDQSSNIPKNTPTKITIDSSDEVNLSSNIAGDSFKFDNMGRPVSCSPPCDIIITGESSVVVRIESQGYIHAL